MKKGFSLLELSISLLILSLALAGALNIAIEKSGESETNITNIRMDKIEDAIAVFLNNNMRIPCPASSSVELNEFDGTGAFGEEDTVDETICLNANGTDGGDIFWGAVPTEALNLPTEYAFDGWNRRLTYAVDLRLANNETTNTGCSGGDCFRQTASGSIRVNDELGDALTTSAIYVLLSHGKNGFGAYNYNGTAKSAASPDSDEQENSNETSNGIFVAESSSSIYDDIVRYRLRSFITDLANTITDSTNCDKAKAVVDGDGGNACVNAMNNAKCIRLATAYYDLCSY